jgi:hypothetical protein
VASQAALIVLLLGACGDDSGAPADALLDGNDAAAADASFSGFSCGPLTCEAGMACCAADPIYTCIEVDQTCGGDTWECDGREDCRTADKCCETGFGGQCLADPTPCSGQLLCHEAAHCPSGVCCPQGFCGPGCD